MTREPSPPTLKCFPGAAFEGSEFSQHSTAGGTGWWSIALGKVLLCCAGSWAGTTGTGGTVPLSSVKCKWVVGQSARDFTIFGRWFLLRMLCSSEFRVRLTPLASGLSIQLISSSAIHLCKMLVSLCCHFSPSSILCEGRFKMRLQVAADGPKYNKWPVNIPWVAFFIGLRTPGQ